MNNKTITSRATLKTILELPNGKKVLNEMKIPCLRCPMMAMEMEKLTIGRICKGYQIDLKKVLEKLNQKKKK